MPLMSVRDSTVIIGGGPAGLTAAYELCKAGRSAIVLEKDHIVGGLARAAPRGPEDSFEDWVSNRFGKRLYRIFFKTYTEKVRGIPCSELSAELAAQRIKGRSLLGAVKTAVFGQNIGSKKGASVRLGTDVECLFTGRKEITAVEISTADGRERIEGANFISSMPIRELVNKLDSPAPPRVRKAADALNYRDSLTIALVVNRAETFPDNWIYIHDPSVKVGRIQNFKNWSPHMAPDPQKSCLGLEYSCFQGDGLWTMDDAALVKMASREVAKLGFARVEEISEGVVVRIPKAYPVYDSTYQESLNTVRTYLKQFRNLQLVGRNGMHILWTVNADQEYHGECRAGESSSGGLTALASALRSTQPLVPACLPASGD